MSWSMGLMPGPLGTRVLVRTEGGTLLRALFPRAPKEAVALLRLCEALALWSGEKVSCVLCADDPDVFSEGSSWLDAAAVDGCGVFELKVVLARAPAPDSGAGPFEEVQAFLERWSEP